MRVPKQLKADKGSLMLGRKRELKKASVILIVPHANLAASQALWKHCHADREHDDGLRNKTCQKNTTMNCDDLGYLESSMYFIERYLFAEVHNHSSINENDSSHLNSRNLDCRVQRDRDEGAESGPAMDDSDLALAEELRDSAHQLSGHQ